MCNDRHMNPFLLCSVPEVHLFGIPNRFCLGSQTGPAMEPGMDPRFAAKSCSVWDPKQAPDRWPKVVLFGIPNRSRNGLRNGHQKSSCLGSQTGAVRDPKQVPEWSHSWDNSRTKSLSAGRMPWGLVQHRAHPPGQGRRTTQGLAPLTKNILYAVIYKNYDP